MKVDEGLSLEPMRKPDTNPESVQMTDVLCDFCHREWGDDIPMVEGHRGSCICGKCLRIAWDSVINGEMNDAIENCTCTMCLEQRSDPFFRSPAWPEAFICRRCIRLTAQAIRKNDDSDWEAPGGASSPQ